MRRALAAMLGLVLSGCGGEDAPPPAPAVAPSAALAEHSKEFRKEIIQVTDGVHVAVGYGIANSILIEGDDGFIVVDTMETVEEARKLNAEFRRIVGGKPLRAIIYTHNHPDHTFGAAGFVQPGENPAIYAHEKVNDALDALITEFRAVIFRRSLRMYGWWLTGDALGNVGIGPYLSVKEGDTLSILRPTRTFKDSLEDTVAGVRFTLQHAPGETDDTIYVWLPDKKALLPGDNFYKAFPNLYTIRGTPYRNPRKWADSLDRIRAIRPEFLVPSHSRPLSGADNIHAQLTDYRDAIRYVYDQTVRGMNAGRTADEIAETIKLPPHLAASPNLQEFYGKPSWSARMIFEGNVGWFDGNPARLQPLAPMEQSRHMARLAGSEGKLREALDAAVAEGDWQWALELSDHVLRLSPDDGAAKAHRVRALTARGDAESNPNARHYYLMSAIELKEGRRLPDQAAKPTPEMLRQMPLSAFFNGMAVNLDAQASTDLVKTVGFEFTDSGEAWTLTVRRGVAEVRSGLAESQSLDLHVKVPAQAFKEMAARLRNPALALAQDFSMVKGSKLEFASFLKLFAAPEES
ncbi:MAG TPA: alkyl sulfatase dimerization domain-containing protein [Verrucomicrobiae bacterium]|nr:alkyl sulfatase dimerization domain-containing protein [Verrucomicrobiae bacterium]